LRSEVVHQRFDFLYVGGCEQFSLKSPSEKVLRFIQRASRDLYNTPVVLEIVAARSFGNVRPDAIGAPDDLLADRVAGKSVPTKSDVPDFVCEFLGQLVNPKIFKICPAHNPQCC
jgi:hypothetical protein